MAALKMAAQKLSTGGADGSTDVEIPETGEVKYFYGSSGHNCGGRCVSRAEVINGKIKRILTDESLYTSDGTYIDPESSNFPQTRACARCRSYKYRLYHPGRLLYPLKQTKKRGDLSGFQRITWEQAIREIAAKHKAVVNEFGVDGIYSIYAWGAATGTFQGASGGPLGAGGAGGDGGAALRYMGGAQSSYFGSYSTHQYRYFGVNYTGADENVNVNSVAKYAKYLVLWGDNTVSTVNPAAYGYVRAAEEMKKRYAGCKILFIGPEFSDGAVVVADEWYASKPYTDPALVASIIYYMLENTFDLATGDLKENPMLDIDYLDTMVYGFFDSPEYWVHNTTGEIVTENPSDDVNYRHVPAVPAGESYCSWVLGNNANAKTYAQLGASRNYTAKQFANVSNFKRWAPCSYRVKGQNATSDNVKTSKYKTKQDYLTPKDTNWSTPITGLSKEAVEAIAKIYIDGPVTSTWSGGQQKQHDGIANLYAIQALHVITKNVGTIGAGFIWKFQPTVTKDSKALSVKVTRPNVDNYVNNTKSEASCTAWHTAIKMAFEELGGTGYTHKYIPNYDKGTDTTPNVYWDDGGTKTFIQWRRNEDGSLKEYTDNNGNTFYDWEGRTSTAASDTSNVDGHAAGTPKISGIRLMYNTGGNIFINQHENSNDSREMLETLPLNDGTANTFCLVSFDNFMSPTPRWSDYVLPAATSWEQQDIMSPTNGSSFYVSQIILPPGESKPTWDFANELVKEYAGQAAATDFTGGVANQSVEAIVKAEFNKAKTDANSPYYGWKWEEFLTNTFLPAKQDDDTIQTPARKAFMDNYKNHTDKTTAFVKPGVSGYFADTNDVTSGGYGNQFANTTTAPQSPKRFQVYSPVLVWQYENKFSKWHGYLPEAQRGQKHRDYEGDAIVLPLPIYYAYEDYFMEAYGLYNSVQSASDIHNTYPVVLTTTHDRYRSHSSMAENPMLRELTHKVPGKRVNPNTNMPFEYKEDELKQGNDYEHYATAPANAFAVNATGEYPVLNSTINSDGSVSTENKEIASYTEIWMSKSVADERGIANGDLVEVYNPIGKVRCVAKISRRCASGYVGLHQGCWYDPREINGETVDVGGNCNTLMASQPSRIDHGNGQQSAMVQIVKVENY